jgi:hypothetical protein
MSERVGLATLVERACGDFLCSDDLADILGEESAYDQPLDERAVVRWFESIVRHIRWECGVGRIRYDTRSFTGWNEPSVAAGMSEEEFGQILSMVIDDNPRWNSFLRSLEEVSRLGDFLSTLETDPRCRPLARDCRDDLSLLNVLADWCEDNERPVTAAEARHLGALVASILRE